MPEIDHRFKRRKQLLELLKSFFIPARKVGQIHLPTLLESIHKLAHQRVQQLCARMCSDGRLA